MGNKVHKITDNLFAGEVDIKTSTFKLPVKSIYINTDTGEINKINYRKGKEVETFSIGQSKDNAIVDVTWFGAVGDGINDDSDAIIKAINYKKSGSIIYFPKGEYFITQQLPAYKYQAFMGEGPVDFADFYYEVNKIEYANIGTRLYWVYLSDNVKTKDLIKYIKGDQIFLSGFENTLHNKPHEISELDLINRRILIKHTYYDSADYDEDNVEGSARIPFSIGGSVIRHRSLDGRTITGEWFINAEGLSYFSLQNIGFVGAGVNNSSGSGIKIMRDDKATESLYFHNVSFVDIPDTALTIEAPINSVFENIRAKKIAFDFMDIVSKSGSATTSTTFKNIYITAARRGIVLDTAVYNLFESIVTEGCSIGIQGNVINSCTFNNISTETTKYRTFRGGQGLSFLFNASYGNTFNSPSVIYNSETFEWVKGAFMFIGSSYGDLPAATLIGGRIHNSLNKSHNLLTYEQTSDTRTRIYYADIHISELTAEYMKAGRFIAVHDRDLTTDSYTRFRVTNVYETNFDNIQTDNTHYDKDADPTADDDSDAGYNVGDTWTNTTADSDWMCIDNTNDNAVWRLVKELSSIEVETDHNESTNMTTIIDKAFSKIGRTVGNDIYTTNAYRTYLYSYDGENKEITLWLDVYDRIPNMYIHSCHLDPVNKTKYNTGMLCYEHEVVSINGTPYLDVKFKASRAIKDADDFDWRDSEIVTGDGSYVKVSYIPGLEEELYASKTKWDKEEQVLHYYFSPYKFIKVDDTIETLNQMNEDINAELTVKTIKGWRVLDEFNKSPHAIKVVCDLDLGDDDLLETESIGVYVLNKIENRCSSRVSLINSPAYRTIDPSYRITRNNDITGEITLEGSELEIDMVTPYDFNWIPFTPNIYIEPKNSTIIIKRTDTSTDVKQVVFKGFPKVNKKFLGVED